jgi:manganese/zinc/iron transport system permease protein
MVLDFTLWNVAAGSALLGAVAGIVGCFALLRRQSLVGDVLAHAALPGICVGYVLAGDKHLGFLLAGALVSALLAAGIQRLMVQWTRLREDTALAICLSVFYGLGILLLTKIQGLAYGSQAGLKTFLFGSAATMLPQDVAVISMVALATTAVATLCFKEFKLILFDAELAQALGFPVRWLDALLTLLVVLTVITGLRVAGVVLMVAAVVMPAAAARQWTHRFRNLLILAAFFGASSGASGALLSGWIPWFKTGPAIVLLAAFVLVASLLLGTERGRLRLWVREWRMATLIHREHLLLDLYRRVEQLGDWQQWVPLEELRLIRGLSWWRFHRLARRLERQGLVELANGRIRQTLGGLRVAQQLIRRHRLWETYLVEQLALPWDHLHRDAEQIEHVLAESLVEATDRALQRPRQDPHGKTIPRPEEESAHG